MHHADRFVDRILFLEGFPNMQTLDPLRIGQNVKEVIDADLAAEVGARALYQEAAQSLPEGARITHHASCSKNLMADEEGHIDLWKRSSI